MPERVEIKIRFQNLAAVAYFERVVKPIGLRQVESPSIDQALLLKKNNKSVEAAYHYFTLAQKAEEPKVRAEMNFELAQVLIDLNIYGQAKQRLVTAKENTFLVSDDSERAYLHARFEEKSAWIADYEGRFFDSLGHLDRAQEQLNTIPREKITDREEGVYSTITHFRGRGYLGYALQNRGTIRESSLRIALSYFRDDLDRFKKLREGKNPQPANEGFNCAWVTRVLLEMGELDLAEKYLEKTKEAFDEFLSQEENKESPIMGHYYLLKGGLEAKRGLFARARQSFVESLSIWLAGGGSCKGEGGALLGIAFCDWANKDFGGTVKYGLRALKTYPYLLLRPMI